MHEVDHKLFNCPKIPFFKIGLHTEDTKTKAKEVAPTQS